ncbi:uncharacterized protein MELLADRAFT_88486 [Melampsora larici-populina 98AG31]|uniref:Uncharacterized protein n=1 Tax=Melampsora larici-populina (strain 98AG31 / pathotype 3-4-7) TaxID=747676 RepID=F4RRW5_MELLP|nr:uncharacterized protein MELLADRAFT_88486 [Melampsora larici-populina 98AG31]EGG04880.1 hypothetical protein MELLADRAFT_88486 [Melampsora larici-populina 98AG31]
MFCLVSYNCCPRFFPMKLSQYLYFPINSPYNVIKEFAQLQVQPLGPREPVEIT